MVHFYFLDARYLQEFGFTIPNRAIMVDDIRVRGCGHSRTSVIHKTTHSSALPPIKKVSLQYVFQKHQLSERLPVLSLNNC